VGTLLLFLAAFAAIFWVFARLFRSRVARRLQDREMPPELAAALQARPSARAPVAAGAASAGVRPAPVASPGPAPAPHFMLIYDLAPDYLARRTQFRDEHLALAWKSAEAGEMVLGGALDEPVEQAFVLFRGSREAALRFAAADPYVKHGLVKAFRVRQWHTVVGAQASMPLRPKV
jgi:uncharacterized protein YciI